MNHTRRLPPSRSISLDYLQPPRRSSRPLVTRRASRRRRPPPSRSISSDDLLPPRQSSRPLIVRSRSSLPEDTPSSRHDPPLTRSASRQRPPPTTNTTSSENLQTRSEHSVESPSLTSDLFHSICSEHFFNSNASLYKLDDSSLSGVRKGRRLRSLHGGFNTSFCINNGTTASTAPAGGVASSGSSICIPVVVRGFTLFLVLCCLGNIIYQDLFLTETLPLANTKPPAQPKE